MQLGGRGSRRVLIALIVLGFALRLSVWPRVFGSRHVFLDGPDGYYHLQRAAMTLQHWPVVPQFDPAINYPAGGTISWPPLFDFLLATLALPFRSDDALEIIGALLPPILGALQLIVLYMLVHSLRGRRAALVAVIVAAILPAVVRYTLLGNLDHDPFFSLCLLLALLGLARDNPWLIAAGLACATLGWTGAIVGVAIVTVVALAVWRRETFHALAIGSSVAAVVVLPFVLMSAWRGATFEGLSWLHLAALAGAGLLGSVVARLRTLIVVNAIAILALAPICVRPFIAGTRYAAGDAPILAMVAEAQPLLKLFGTFDVWPMLIRFGLLPFLAIAVIVVQLRDRETPRPRDLMFLAPWLLITFTLALLHSRFSFDAGLALAAFTGVAFERLKRASILAIALLPIVPAYLPIPSLEGYNFYLRPNALRDYQMEDISLWLRGRPPGAVLAPWSFGHWIVWIAKKPVVIGPMLSVGQSEFADGLRWFFLEDPAAAARWARSHGVRYIIVTPELSSIEARARVAGLDPVRYLDRRTYARTIGARLMFFGPPPGFRELLRSRLVRVYELQ
jgi:dolichyl-diphosphooligosaccharide--protein glycosyltransferase